ncbi:hypothetical protein [Arundinibacter roseus]|uniref:CRISPR-associated protein Csh1 n=1 Tax=Arundinibacter roseus TaxID=2070510 RepID=A0A4R4KIB8_9BACT|nr:hypothetical protein [Arundinibacter roseus]TDB67894.1 hypothetical protein EZE20_02920 [Arundinibacter roseus]
MIKEIVNFTQNLGEDFKNLAYRPSKGLHILTNIAQEGDSRIEKYVYYDGVAELDEDLSQILSFERYSSYISMNQQQKFDKKQKIHSASPFSIAFNFSLGSDKQKIETIIREIKSKMDDPNDKDELELQIKLYKMGLVKESIPAYFINAQKLCLDVINQDLESKITNFEKFCLNQIFEEIPKMKIKKDISKKKDVQEIIDVSILSELKEKDYIRVYLTDIPLDEWKDAYERYYMGEYPPNEFNDNDFISTFPDKKPFMSHKTATFETYKINGVDANILKQFKDVVSAKPKVIPNPFPLFIYQEELQEKVIALYNQNRLLTFTEIINSLWENYKKDFNNYYLINWYVGKDIVFKDFDFVSKFEYELDAQIENFFEIQEKGGKSFVFYPKINNIFTFEQAVFKPLLQNKYLRLDYFSDLKNEDYEHLGNTFQAFSKYRKAVYDFVYKSKRQGIDEHIFSDMVFSHIKDDLKQNNGYSIKEKLNIWFSLYENFQPKNRKNEITMASKLKQYQEFVARLSMGEADTDTATDADFAFAAGQVIDYILRKSRSDDTSYRLLEPYLQQSKLSEFRKAIAKDFDRYRHENFSKKFRNAAAFVLSYREENEQSINMKDFMPELLAGVFSENQLFADKQKDNN